MIRDVRTTTAFLTLVATVGASVFVAASSARDEVGSACARGYSPCLPVVSDLDCGQIPESKKPVRVTGADPYALDRERDGLGCEVAGEGGGRASPWGLILRKPPSKEATQAGLGDVLYVFGWSPASMRGKRYQLCSPGRGSYLQCNPSLGTLNGRIQRFGTWRITRATIRYGVFTLLLRVNFKVKASDTVRIR